jgi:cobalt-zinc-cadmium efflux system membrane fusion protein
MHEEEMAHPHEHENTDSHVLTEEALGSLELKTGPLRERKLHGYVRTSGVLAVPPQNRAMISAVVGGNIRSIRVIPGEIVKQGQVLATMSHPDIIDMQTEYTEKSNRLDYLEKEYDRQKKLYEEEVGSGKNFQEVKAEYLTLKGRVKGLEAQLKQLNIDPHEVKDGEIREVIPIRSPISGAVNQVNVSIGQYAPPQASLFEIIDNHHIHVDLHVYEKDIAKVSKGQKVFFHLESTPDTEFPATIFAVGSTFEEASRAVSVHAEIIGDKPKNLLPGMYVRGKILIDETTAPAIPEEGLVRDGDAYYIFAVRDSASSRRHFHKIRVQPGKSDAGWVEITPIDPLPKDGLFAYTEAYYILSDMSETEHGHDH